MKKINNTKLSFYFFIMEIAYKNFLLFKEFLARLTHEITFL